ncbi:tetratricopeptide repeat protein [Burkholderia pseudomallei]
MEDLNATVRDEIDALFIRANGKLESGEKSGAIQDAEAAWKTLPEPKFGWDVSKSFAHALAKMYRDTGNFKNAIALMNELFASGTVKPYQDGPRFVAATIYFEMGDNENAMKWFDEANKISKGRCFRGEDKKYQDFYKNRVAGK